MLTVTRGFTGDVASVSVTTPGTGYVATETITILGANVGGSTPTDNVVVTVDNVSADGPNAKVEDIILTSGNITTLVVDRQNNAVNQGDSIAKVGTPATIYETDTVTQRNVYYLDAVSYTHLRAHETN